MNIRKYFRITLDNYYITLHNNDQFANDYEADANRLHDICIQCGYHEESLRKIAEQSYWNN